MIFLWWLRRVGKFLWTRPLLLEAARHPDSWQTTSWANQLKTFIGDTFGMYKMSWSDQKKNVWWGRRDERGKKRGSSTLSYIQQLAPKQLSAAMTRVHEEHHKVTGGSCHALTSSRAEEKMKPGDSFLLFCLTVIHFSSCLFVTFKGKCLERQIRPIKWKPIFTLGNDKRPHPFIRPEKDGSLLKAKTRSPALRSLHLLLKWHQKKSFQHACKQPTESTEAILGGARAFLFCCKHDHHFRKTKTNRNNKTYESNHNFFLSIFFLFCLSSSPNDSDRNWTTENFTKVHISM